MSRARVGYRYPADVPLRFGLRWHNFSEQPRPGSWELNLPAGWRHEPGSVLRGSLTLPPLSDSNVVVVLRPPQGISPARRDRLTLRWRGADGETDRCVVQLAADGPASGPQETFSPDWQTSAGQAIQWTRIENRLMLTKRAPGVTPDLILPLHGLRQLQPDDVFRFRLRLADPSRTVLLRSELITPRREVFRHGEDQPVGPGWQTFELRVGDLTPAFWSHAGRGDPTASRYLRLNLFGLTEGESLEVSRVGLIRAQSSAKPAHAPRK